MASIFTHDCKCKDCGCEFPDHHAVKKNVGGWEEDITWVCPQCGSDDWDYLA